VRINPIDDEVSHPVGKGLGLARARTGDYEQWSRIESGSIVYAVLNGTSLLLVQVRQIIVSH